MKIYIKYIILILVIIGAVIGLKILSKPNLDNQIRDYLIEKGYVLEEYSDLYIKQESSNKKTSFSLGDYTYMLNVEDSKNDMQTSLNATYYFKNENKKGVSPVVYSYRVRYSDNINVWFKGTYDGENFTCDKEFSSAKLTDSEISNICNLAKLDVQIFELEAKTLFNKSKFVDYIKNK